MCVCVSWLNIRCKFGAYLLRLQQQLCILMVFFFLSPAPFFSSLCGFMCDCDSRLFSFFFASFFSVLLETVPPSVKAVNHVVGAPVESHVLLECIVEVFPKPLNGWYRNEGKQDITPTNSFFRSFVCMFSYNLKHVVLCLPFATWACCILIACLRCWLALFFPLFIDCCSVANIFIWMWK